MTAAHANDIRLVVLSTDVAEAAGGVAVALAGFLRGIRAQGALAAHLVTHRPGQDKVGPALSAAVRLPGVLRRVRRQGHVPVVVGHAGGMLSVLRVGSLLRLARALEAPTVLQLHSVTMDDWLVPGWRHTVLRGLVSAADVLCAATPTWRDTFSAHGLGPCRVVPNALPPDAEAALAVPPAPRPRAKRLRIGTMTRLVPGKGVDLLVRALAHLGPHDRLHVAGTGPDRDALAALAETLGLTRRVRFHGWVGADAKDAFFRGCDVFALPSAYDSFGMGLIEAMARGVPVVGLRTGAAADILRDGLDGALAAPTPDGVARAIGTFRDGAVRAAAARAAQERVRTAYTSAAVARAALSAAAEAIHRRRR